RRRTDAQPAPARDTPPRTRWPGRDGTSRRRETSHRHHDTHPRRSPGRPADFLTPAGRCRTGRSGRGEPVPCAAPPPPAPVTAGGRRRAVPVPASGAAVNRKTGRIAEKRRADGRARRTVRHATRAADRSSLDRAVSSQVSVLITERPPCFAAYILLTGRLGN